MTDKSKTLLTIAIVLIFLMILSLFPKRLFSGIGEWLFVIYWLLWLLAIVIAILMGICLVHSKEGKKIRVLAFGVEIVMILLILCPFSLISVPFSFIITNGLVKGQMEGWDHYCDNCNHRQMNCEVKKSELLRFSFPDYDKSKEKYVD